MKIPRFAQFEDGPLMQHLTALATRDCALTAELLACLGEVDARKLYIPAGHPSMTSYCVHVLRMSEDVAFKRIHVARLARRFPTILEAVAAGRLHLSGILVLGPYLTSTTAADLLKAAVHRTRAEIELLVAERFPRPDLPTQIEPVVPACSPNPEQVNGQVLELANQLAPGRVNGQVTNPHAPEPVHAVYTKVTPLTPERFAMQVTISVRAHELLREAQELLGHQVPAGDIPQVLEMALAQLVQQLKKRKFAATQAPRQRRRGSKAPRHIPAAIRREVWERDQGQCTFVSDSGHRCPGRRGLEFDHIEPVARGGEATVANVRLRCRAHNQYEAERVFGAGFMEGRRSGARERRTHAAQQPAAARG